MRIFCLFVSELQPKQCCTINMGLNIRLIKCGALCTEFMNVHICLQNNGYLEQLIGHSNSSIGGDKIRNQSQLLKIVASL